jgi:hypothetical protein
MVEAGEDFLVTYDVLNNGGTDTCFGYILDVDSETEFPNTRWQAEIPSGGQSSIESTLTGRTTPINARIVVGYYTE